MSGEGTTVGSWHQDEASLLSIARRARTGVPVIPGYADLVELKRGGQGVVYSAVQRSTHRKVAIKVLLAGHLATEAQKRRFERETELAASLRHPNVVRIYDSGMTGEGWAYLVMEYVEGRAIDEHARGLSGESRARALVGVFTKVCDAVAHAHQRGVIHRDLKPSNIRVDDGGEPHVLDFGLAKLEGVQETREVSVSGQFLGSLPWASPEQADGTDAVDVRSDVYSLGVVLYQLLSGRLPYDVEGSMTRALENIRGATPHPLEGSGVDEDLATIVLKCLVKEA
jgi:serine/threonine protein kinase